MNHCTSSAWRSIPSLARMSAPLLLAALVAPGARADAYVVGARTEAEVYRIPAWSGRQGDDPELIGRYRLVQSLDLGAYDLTSSRGRDRLDFVAYLRLMNDFGFHDRGLLDDARNPEVDLLFGYLQWSHVLGGLLDLRLGRQIRFDQLFFYALDGLDVQVHTPAHVGVGLMAGWMVKGTSLAGSATFAPDGVRGSDRRRIADGVTTDLLSSPADEIAYPYLDAPSPMFGARLELEGIRGVEAIVSWRRAISRTSAGDLDELPDDARGWQTELEHAGAGARLRLFGWSWIYASADRDLYRDRWAALRAGVRAEPLAPRLSITAEAARYHPSFSADSIWNLFATGARDEYELRAEWAPDGPFRYYGGPLFVVYHLDLSDRFASEAADAGNPLNPRSRDLLTGGYAGVSLRPGLVWRASLDASYLGGPPGEVGQLGYLGRELWLNAVVGRDFRSWISADLRLSVANVSDPYQAGIQDLWSFGAAALGRMRFTDDMALLLVVEENANRFRRGDLRGYAVFDWRVPFG
ncbi:MAG TPA: hypothetical protein VN033_04650 [Vulgatibacter sp.]|nr:hypothetical protein [Vulgatibacter sp.]